MPRQIRHTDTHDLLTLVALQMRPWVVYIITCMAPKVVQCGTVTRGSVEIPCAWGQLQMQQTSILLGKKHLEGSSSEGDQSSQRTRASCSASWTLVDVKSAVRSALHQPSRMGGLLGQTGSAGQSGGPAPRLLQRSSCLWWGPPQ